MKLYTKESVCTNEAIYGTIPTSTLNLYHQTS
jgi:hypothetical protein